MFNSCITSRNLVNSHMRNQMNFYPKIFLMPLVDI